MKRFLIIAVCTTALWSCGEAGQEATSTEAVDSVEASTPAVDSVAAPTDTTAAVATPN